MTTDHKPKITLCFDPYRNQQYVGNRCAMFGGCLMFALGAALTYFTLDAGLPAVAFTYGFVSAFGQGIALIPTMVRQMNVHSTE